MNLTNETVAENAETPEDSDPFVQITKLKTEYDAAVAQIGGEAILQKAKEIVFDQNPTVKKIGWTQYTPYFNDGDACEFGVGEPYGITGDMDEDEQEEAIWSGVTSLMEQVPFAEASDEAKATYINSTWKPQYIFEPSQESQALTEFYISIMNNSDILLKAFGDHRRIEITPDLIEVSWYDHD